MGGEGSGRRPSTESILNKSRQNFVASGAPYAPDNQIVWPNLSGVKPEARIAGAGTFTAGSVLFSGTDGKPAQDNANLFWDDTNNRLGIGTTTPASRLEVGANGTTDETITVRSAGSSILSLIADSDNDGSEAGAPYVLLSQDGALVAGILGLTQLNNQDSAGTTVTNAIPNSFLFSNRFSSGNMQFATNGAVRQTIDSTGNVGIGTTEPGFKLHISGTGSGVTTAPILLLQNSTDDDTAKQVSVGTRTRIGNTGAVGRYLYAQKTGGENNSNLGSGRAGVITDYAIEYSNNTYSTIVAPDKFLGWGWTVYNGTTYQDLMRITSGGKVGIGTTSPNQLFTISGGAFASNNTSAPTLTLSQVSGSFFISGGAFFYKGDQGTVTEIAGR